ncbi:HEPN domain-containing protein [Streptomyces sp. NBC_01268]|uniref:HEPN domain-containing protein n=1 Tax=Streptomyces sp. NBC_01268 TaxID=2903806 RepID=UPI002E36A662|nr:HEPN domain-containing protein [Streptomyces sp. NBC_01268]
MNELRRHLIPRTFEPTGLYSDRVYEHARAFRVLAHAEFESYIEDRAIEVVQRAHTTWDATGRVRPCLLALMSHRESKIDIPDTLSEVRDSSTKYPTLKGRIEIAKKRYSTYIRRENHGIKERNLLLILLPIGISREEINSEWLETTDGWATARGEVAHTSPKVQHQINPQIELQTVNTILKGFKEIDVILDEK